MTVAEIRAYAAERRFPRGLVERWLRLGARDREALGALVRRTRPGANQMRDFLDLLEDTAARRGTAVAAVLADPAVRGAIEGARSRNEAIAAVRRVLRRLRYPALAATEERLRELARGLRLPAAVSVEFPRDLEGDEIAFVIRASCPAELAAAARALGEAASRAEVEAMFRVLGGEA